MKRRSSMPPQRYEPTARTLAVDPKAFLELFIVPQSRENEMIGEVCVVDICGPLDTYDCGWGDSYEAIKRRVGEACASSARAVVMRIDSPGGDCSGCFDTARAIRAMCRAARKPLYAHCDVACSAGYALASAAEYLAMTDTGTVGSIGVLQTRFDASARNAMDGFRIEFIASGTRKAYGHSDAAITDAEIKDTKAVVDYVGGVFCALVEEHRGIPAADVFALQAGVFHAEAALRARLVDEVTTFDAMLARVARGERLIMSGKKSTYESARESLEELAKGDDANAAAAKRALAELQPPEEEESGDDDDKATVESDDDDKVAAVAAETGEDDKTAAAAAEGPTDDDKKPKPAAAAASGAAASTHSIALEALAKAHTLEAKLAAKDDADERKRLLDTRKDFDPALRAELMKASTPIATVRSMVKTLPRKAIAKPATASSVSGTRGASAGAPASLGSDPRSAEAIELDRKMGLTEQTLGVKRVGNALTFGVVDKPPAAAASGTGGGAK